MLPFQKAIGKRKPRRFSLIRLPFALCANVSLPFVHLLTKKQTEVIRLQIAERTKWPIYGHTTYKAQEHSQKHLNKVYLHIQKLFFMAQSCTLVNSSPVILPCHPDT